jgi:hypothetical protein
LPHGPLALLGLRQLCLGLSEWINQNHPVLAVFFLYSFRDCSAKWQEINSPVFEKEHMTVSFLFIHWLCGDILMPEEGMLIPFMKNIPRNVQQQGLCWSQHTQVT